MQREARRQQDFHYSSGHAENNAQRGGEQEDTRFYRLIAEASRGARGRRIARRQPDAAEDADPASVTPRRRPPAAR